MSRKGAPLPKVPGYYLLMLKLEGERYISVGKRGTHRFPAGRYFYVGSAQGKGGLGARLSRHLESKQEKRLFWHIDYLRRFALVQAIAFLTSPGVALPTEEAYPPVTECLFSQLLMGFPRANIPLRGFGASDCRSGCPAHLIHFPFQEPTIPDEAVLQRMITWLSKQSGKELHFYWIAG